ncbi:berberine bridge enzyme-like 8 [Pyrus x bretschneideri]|uniref:berberine bridge enzyme-like 8 n=1 Tax=Pyrus x bretschneideri TaxID=225117 RepID=UPI00202E19EE|nr:berberine bridge enzyme-like 8 [Pyrus x bretschneideri]
MLQMAIPRLPHILQLSVLVLLSISWAVSASASADHETFVDCLLNHSQPSHPIAPAIHTSNNASYSSILESYIRNLRFNTSTTQKPFLILTALHESHVQISVVCAQIHNFQMKIRSGGHDFEGLSYVAEFPFFIFDMFNLRSIHVDIKSETAWAQAGATLGELYYRIAEKSKIHGFPAGVCPTVGVGGHFSGGGYGNMMRKYGLSVDNIVDAQLVNVHGKLLDRKSMGEDLFWAITGGGGASFGVVIAYKINLVRVPETVTVFKVPRTLEQNATDIVYRWQYIADKLDNDLFIRLIMDIVNGTTSNSSGENNKTLRASFIAMFLGDSERLLSIMDKSFPELGMKQSDCNEMSWAQSVLFWTSFPTGTATEALLSRTPQVLTHFKRKSDYVKKPIPKAGLKWIFQKMIELEAPLLTFNPHGGKMSEISASATPFPHRAGNLWMVQYATNWNIQGTEASDHYIDLTRKLYMYMTPFVSKNPREAFYSYKDLDIGTNHNANGIASYLEGRVFGIKYFRHNFDRLVNVKTKVDPGNFFRNEQSIPPLPYSHYLASCCACFFSLALGLVMYIFNQPKK